MFVEKITHLREGLGNKKWDKQVVTYEEFYQTREDYK